MSALDEVVEAMKLAEHLVIGGAAPRMARQAAAELQALRAAVVTTELESLLLATKYNMDADREFAGKCLEKSLMVVRDALAALEKASNG